MDIVKWRVETLRSDERLVLKLVIGENMGRELEVILKVKVRTHFYNNESDEGTVRYLLEQDLEDAGWDCDVEILKE